MNLDFRVWDTTNKQWIDNFYLKDGDVYAYYFNWQGDCGYRKLEDYILMSYTQRKDIKNKNAYVGDVVKYMNSYLNECIGVIRFGEYSQDGSRGVYEPRKCFGLYIERIKVYEDVYGSVYAPSYQKTISLSEIAEFEIVGNEIDNPGLLGESND